MKLTAREQLLNRLLAITELMVRVKNRWEGQALDYSRKLKNDNWRLLWSESELYAKIDEAIERKTYYLNRLNRSYLETLERLNNL
jgi:hypothetical protein